VGIADVFERGPNVAEADWGGVGAIGGEKNSGHFGVLSRRSGFSALNCFNYIKLSGKVSGIIVPD
jgi:hypothetical protein